MSDKIQVCDKCFHATCWAGIFMCEKSRDAGTVYKTKGELKKINTGEHPSWWKTDQEYIDEAGGSKFSKKSKVSG